MKIKSIASLCKQANQINVYNVSDRQGVVIQWIGTGTATFPIGGLPYLNKRQIFCIFDIADDKAGDYLYIENNINPGDSLHTMFEDFPESADETENELIEMNMEIGFIEYYRMFSTKSNEIIFVQSSFLAPTDKMDKKTYILRNHMIIVKSGLLNCGLVVPYRAHDNQQLIKNINTITGSLMAQALKSTIIDLAEKARQQEMEEQQE